MKKFNKRPSKAAVNKAIEFYRTEAKNTDEQLTVPCSDMCIHSIRDYAVAHGIKTNDIGKSFRRLLDAVPGMSEHVEACRRGNVYGGEPFIDYRLDAVGYLAFLYWRAVRGRLPEELFEGRKLDE
ncbi:hypothetical protein [uncultured Sutterella sp.]|uniref:hypothetical protein n=1 Tax=uncultured Sutterella sp. TaxID=286133 RepID=UPI00266BFC24|nr:hypothetical protein [uncultured Sutterella sp.]